MNEILTKTPSLAHINFIILTLLQISEEEEYSWVQFLDLLKVTCQYIQEWKSKEVSENLYKKVVSEILPNIDDYYHKKNGSNDPFLSTFIKEIPFEAKNVISNLKYLPLDSTFKKAFLEDYFSQIKHRAKMEFGSVKNKKGSLHFQYLNEFLNLLQNPEENENILNSLKNYRFDKRNFKNKLTHSIILGADDGVYVLLNSLSEKEQKTLLDDSHMNEEMLRLKTNEEGKIVIGKGSFGKIRMAMAIIPNSKSETSLYSGDVICVKKAGTKKQKNKLEIWQSTWNDYCSIDFLSDIPEIYDIKITNDCNGQLQGYCFQKLLMLPSGEIFEKYGNDDLHTWFHVKCYFLGILNLMIELHKRGVCMTDLKPANTLYDIKKRTTKLVDIAGAVRSEKLTSCKIKLVSELSPKYADPDLVSQWENSEDLPEQEVDLTKCISWSVGYMLEHISKNIREFKATKKDPKIEKIKDAVESLSANLKKTSPTQRISLEQGLKRLLQISDLKLVVHNNFEGYIKHLKDRLDNEDKRIQEILNLKNDIYLLDKCFNHNMKITANDPKNMNNMSMILHLIKP